MAASTPTETNKQMTSEVTDEPAVTDSDDYTDKYTSDPHGQQAGWKDETLTWHQEQKTTTNHIQIKHGDLLNTEKKQPFL